MVVKLKDIADRVGVSVTAVSLVLNNKESKIAEKTKKRILQAAKDMNYRPNQVAISLKNRSSKTIGLIVPDIRNSFFSSLARGIEERCRELDYTLILCNTSDRHKRDIEYIRMLRAKNVDGVLYCMSSDSNKEIFKESVRLLKANDLPFILVDRHFDIRGVISITLDHREGGYLATKHLLELGHRKIACITGPSNLTDAQDRVKGYSDALKEYGIRKNKKLIKEGQYNLTSGIEMTKELIESGVDFSAIFACNDLMAFGAYKAIRDKGLSVPNDISLMGYDDIFLTDIFEVPLTSIHQPVEELGNEATDKLIELIDRKTHLSERVLLEPKLVVRESTSKFNK